MFSKYLAVTCLAVVLLGTGCNQQSGETRPTTTQSASQKYLPPVPISQEKNIYTNQDLRFHIYVPNGITPDVSKSTVEWNIDRQPAGRISDQVMWHDSALKPSPGSFNVTVMVDTNEATLLANSFQSNHATINEYFTSPHSIYRASDIDVKKLVQTIGDNTIAFYYYTDNIYFGAPAYGVVYAHITGPTYTYLIRFDGGEAGDPNHATITKYLASFKAY